MLTISLLRSADYYLNATSADYYLVEGEPPGEWYGKGAERLGLSGRVIDQYFRDVFDGFEPGSAGGAALVANAGNPNRQPGWDLTFSAPKTVSVLWALGPGEVGKIIEACAEKAVKDTLSHLESTVAYSRTGKGGMGKRKKVDLTIGIFRHSTSRALDPQLHHHCTVLNVGIDDEGVSRTIVSRLLYQHKMLGGAYYRAALASYLEQELGTRAVRKGSSFDIEGVPDWIADIFSKGRKAVLQEMDKKGLHGAKAAAKVAKYLRRDKSEIPPLDSLRSSWAAEYEDALALDKAKLRLVPGKVLGKRKRNSESLIDSLVNKALENLTAKRAHFTAADLSRECLVLAPEAGVGPVAVLRRCSALLDDDPRIVRLETFVEGRYTTLKNLEQEAKLLQAVAELVEEQGASVSERVLKRVQVKHTNPDASGKCLNEEQEKAFLELVESSRSIRFLHGLAGTGKTSFTLRACVDAWTQAGYEVRGAAPTKKAAEVLKADTGIPTETIHSFMGDYEVSLRDRLKHEAKQFARAAQGRKTWKRKNPKPRKLTAKSVVIVDESSMVDSRQFLMLARHAFKANATLIFVGDPYQLPPISGTAPFKSVSRLCGHSELVQIQRQQQQWARDASYHFYMGEPGKALRLFKENDRLFVEQDKEQTLELLVEKWSYFGLMSPQKTIVVASMHRDCDSLNELCQRARLKTGRVDSGAFGVAWDTRDGKAREIQVYKHDRILLTENDKQKGIANGDFGTITAIGERHLTVRLDKGPVVSVDVYKYPHIRLGYASTTYSSQGSTFDRAYILAGEQMQDLPTSYVQATRFSKEAFLFTTDSLLSEHAEDLDDSPLAAAMSRRPDLSLASDLVFKPHLVANTRGELFAQIIQDYVSALSSSDENRCIVAPTLPHAEGFNAACHLTLAQQQGIVATTENGQELVMGDKVMIEAAPPEHLIIKGRRASVAQVSLQNRVTLKFDEPLPHNRETTVVLDGDSISTSYAHAMSVDQANAKLRNCPQPHILLDTPPPLQDFTATETAGVALPDEAPVRTLRGWLWETGEAFGTRVSDYYDRLEAEAAEREKNSREARERQAADDYKRYRYKEQQQAVFRELEEIAAKARKQEQEQVPSRWWQDWQDIPLQPSSGGLSPQIALPTSYQPSTQPVLATPALDSVFSNTYQLASGLAAHHQQQQQLHLQSLRQAQQQIHEQTQTQVQVHVQQQNV